MTEKTNRDELTPDERAFLRALDEADEAAMISVFAKVNGTKNLDAPPIEKSAPADNPARELDTDLIDVSLNFIEAWKHDDGDALQKLIDQKRGQPLPPSHVARERSRDRAIAPDIRLSILSVLEEIQTLISDTAFRIMTERPHYKETSIFEGDEIATELLHGICDFLSLYPDINQISSEYHVNPFFDLEWDYSKKTYTAFDRNRKVQFVDYRGDSDDDKE